METSDFGENEGFLTAVGGTYVGPRWTGPLRLQDSPAKPLAVGRPWRYRTSWATQRAPSGAACRMPVACHIHPSPSHHPYWLWVERARTGDLRPGGLLTANRFYFIVILLFSL